MSDRKSVRFLSSLLAVFILLPVFVFAPLTVQAASTVDISIDSVTRKYKEAAKWLGYVNELREQNKLSSLVMDTDLMELAMKRSAELSVYVGNSNLDGTSVIGGSYAVEYFTNAYGKAISKSSVVSESNKTVMTSSLKSIGIGYVTGKGSINYLVLLTSSKTPNKVDDSVLTQSNVKMNQKTKCSTAYLSDLTLSPATGSSIESGSELSVKFLVSNGTGTSSTAYVTGDTYLTTTNSAIIKTVNPNNIVALKQGQATIGMHFSSAPSISASAVYTVVPGTTSNFVVTPIPNQIYTGRAITPEVTVKTPGGAILKVGTDYTLTYSNNINVGTASVVVNGIGAYAGKSETVKFNIVKNENAFSITVSASKATMTLGESISILATPTNGSTPIKYKFDYAVTGTSSYTVLQAEGTANKAAFKPTKTGNYTVRVTAKDNAGKTAVSDVKISVGEALKCTAKLSLSSITVGNTVSISGTASGGTSPYTYEIAVKKPGSSSYATISAKSSSSSCTYKPDISGSYEFRVKITDKEGATASDTKVLTVNDAALVNNSTVSPSSVTAGTKVTLKGAASGGAGSYKYAFYYKEPSASNWITIGTAYGSATSASFTPDKAGNYGVKIDVKDKAGTVKSKTFTVTSTAKTLVNNSKISATSVQKGTSVTLTAAASGGSGSYQYAYYYKEPSSSSWVTIKAFSTTTSTKFTPNKVGSYSIRIDVKDGAGKVVQKTFTLKSTAKALVNNSKISAAEVKVGTKVTLTGAASEGTGSYTYAFYYKEPSSSTWKTIKGFSTTNTAAFTPDKIGSYSIKIDVKDSSVATVSKTFTLKSTAKALVNNSKISAAEVKVGTKVTLTGAASEGTGSYTYAFYYKEPISSTWKTIKGFSTTNTAAFTPDKIGSYSIKIDVKDSSSATVSKTFTLKSTAKALVNNSKISAAEVKVGTKVTLTGAASEGTGSYTYAFYYKEPSSSTWKTIKGFSTTNTASFTPDKIGSYSIKIDVKDSSSATVSKTFTLKSMAKLLLNNSKISATEVNVGTKVTLTGAASEGTGSYKYAFYYKEPSSTSWKTLKSFSATNTAVFTTDKIGSYSIKIDVKDSAATTVSKTFTLKSKAKPLVNNSKISAAEVKVGTKITLTGAASQGTGSYKYSFYYKEPSTTAWKTLKTFSEVKTATLTPNKVGTYGIKIEVKDSASTVVAKTFTLKSTAKPLINNSKISASSVKVGSRVSLTAAASQGTGSYKYAFYYKTSSSGCKTIKNYSTSKTATFTPNKAGTYSIRIDVKDSAGTVKSKTFTLKCSVSALVNSSKISSSNVKLGAKITLTASASGGTGSYKYAFYYKAPSTSSWKTIKNYSTSKKASFVPNKTGNYSVKINVKDNAGTVKSKTFTIKSTAKTLVNNSKISSKSVTIGTKIKITGSASEGTKSYKYAYYYKAPSSSKWKTLKNYSTSKSAIFTPNKTGTYSVKVNVKDSAGTVKAKTFTVKVVKALANSSTVSAKSVKAGSKLTLRGAASGGTSPYKYAYYYKKTSASKWTTAKNFSTSKSVSVTFKSKGTYNVKITVKDSTGKTVSKSYKITVK